MTAPRPLKNDLARGDAAPDLAARALSSVYLKEYAEAAVIGINELRRTFKYFRDRAMRSSDLQVVRDHRACLRITRDVFKVALEEVEASITEVDARANALETASGGSTAS